MEKDSSNMLLWSDIAASNFHHNTSVAITIEYISITHHGSSAHPPVWAEVTAQGWKWMY